MEIPLICIITQSNRVNKCVSFYPTFTNRLTNVQNARRKKILEKIEQLPCDATVKNAVAQLVGTVVSEITGTPFKIRKKVTELDIVAGAQFGYENKMYVTIIDVTAAHMHFNCNHGDNTNPLWLLAGLGANQYRSYSNRPYNTKELINYLNVEKYEKL